MSKKNKSNLASLIRERAQNPDFQPHNIVEDSTRLADETIPSSREPALPRDHEPSRAHDPATIEPTNHGQPESQVTRSRAPALPPHNRSPNTSAYRRTLHRTSTYLATKTKDQLRTLVFNERTSEEDILREALNLLFENRKLPQIAFLEAPSRKNK